MFHCPVGKDFSANDSELKLFCMGLATFLSKGRIRAITRLALIAGKFEWYRREFLMFPGVFAPARICNYSWRGNSRRQTIRPSIGWIVFNRPGRIIEACQ
jgi:hypothetical protein